MGMLFSWLVKSVNQQGNGVSFGKYFVNHQEVTAEQYHSFMGRSGSIQKPEKVEVYDPKTNQVFGSYDKDEAVRLLKEQEEDEPNHGLLMRPVSKQENKTEEKTQAKQPKSKVDEPSDYKKLKTGEPSSVVVYRGETKGGSGTGLAAIGHGVYYGLEPKVAERFSRADTITSKTINLHNPLVVHDEDQWIDLKKQAENDTGEDFGKKGNMYSGLLLGNQPKKFSEYLSSLGHDSLVVTFKEAPGGEQVLILPKEKMAKPMSSPLPWLTKQASKPKDSNYTGVVFGKYFINGQQVDESAYRAYAASNQAEGKKGPPPIPQRQQQGKPTPANSKQPSKPGLDDLFDGSKEQVQRSQQKPQGADPFAEYNANDNAKPLPQQGAGKPSNTPPPLPKQQQGQTPRPSTPPQQRGELHHSLTVDGTKRNVKFHNLQQKQGVLLAGAIDNPQANTPKKRAKIVARAKQQLQQFANKHFNGDVDAALAYGRAEHQHLAKSVANANPNGVFELTQLPQSKPKQSGEPPALPQREDTIPRPNTAPATRGQLVRTLDMDGKKKTVRFSSLQQRQAVEAYHDLNKPAQHNDPNVNERRRLNAQKRLQAFANQHFDGDLDKAKQYAKAEYAHVQGKLQNSKHNVTDVGKLPPKYKPLANNPAAVAAANNQTPAEPPPLPVDKLTAGSKEDLQRIPKVGADFWDDAQSGPATPPPIPEHHATQKTALDAAKNALTVAQSGDRDAMTKAHQAAYDAINAHEQAGHKEIDRLATEKYGYTPKAKQVAHASKQKFAAKLQAARDKIRKASFAIAPPAVPNAPPPLPNESMPFDWSDKPEATQAAHGTSSDAAPSTPAPAVSQPQRDLQDTAKPTDTVAGQPKSPADAFQQELDKSPAPQQQVTPQPTTQPEAAKQPEPPRDARHNPDLDDFFNGPSEVATPKPQSDLRQNDALDDVFGEPVDEATLRAQQPYNIPKRSANELQPTPTPDRQTTGQASASQVAPEKPAVQPPPVVDKPANKPPVDALHIDNSHQHAPVRPSQHTHPELAGMESFKTAHPDHWETLRDIHANHLSSSAKTLERAVNRQNREVERASEPGGHPDDIAKEKSIHGLLSEMHDKAQKREAAVKESKQQERLKAQEERKAKREAEKKAKQQPKIEVNPITGQEKEIDPAEEKRREAARRRIERFRTTEPKRIPQNKLRYVVRQMGGIDPKDYEKNFGSVKEDLKEGGLQSLIRHSKVTNAAGAMSGEGRSFDQIADRLVESGHISPPENMHATDYLIQQLQADADHNHAVDEHRNIYEEHQAMLSEAEKRQYLEQSTAEELSNAASVLAQHGYLQIPEGQQASEYLKQVLQSNSPHDQADFEREHAYADTQYNHILEEARSDGLSESEINEALRSGEKEGLLASQEELTRQDSDGPSGADGQPRDRHAPFRAPEDWVGESGVEPDVDETEQFDRNDEGLSGDDDFNFGANASADEPTDSSRNRDEEEAYAIEAERRRRQADIDEAYDAEDEDILRREQTRRDAANEMENRTANATWKHNRRLKHFDIASLLTVELAEPTPLLPWLTKAVNDHGDGVSFGRYFLGHQEVTKEQYHAATNGATSDTGPATSIKPHVQQELFDDEPSHDGFVEEKKTEQPAKKTPKQIPDTLDPADESILGDGTGNDGLHAALETLETDNADYEGIGAEQLLALKDQLRNSVIADVRPYSEILRKYGADKQVDRADNKAKMELKAIDSIIDKTAAKVEQLDGQIDDVKRDLLTDETDGSFDYEAWAEEQIPELSEDEFLEQHLPEEPNARDYLPEDSELDEPEEGTPEYDEYQKALEEWVAKQDDVNEQFEKLSENRSFEVNKLAEKEQKRNERLHDKIYDLTGKKQLLIESMEEKISQRYDDITDTYSAIYFDSGAFDRYYPEHKEKMYRQTKKVLSWLTM